MRLCFSNILYLDLCYKINWAIFMKEINLSLYSDIFYDHIASFRVSVGETESMLLMAGHVYHMLSTPF